MNPFERGASPSPERVRDGSVPVLKLRRAISRLPGGNLVPDDAIVSATADVSRKAAGLIVKGAKNTERAVRASLKRHLMKLHEVPDASAKEGYDMFVETSPPAESDAVLKATYGRDIPPLRT